MGHFGFAFMVQVVHDSGAGLLSSAFGGFIFHRADIFQDLPIHLGLGIVLCSIRPPRLELKSEPQAS